jgi:hypothetical protein
MHLAGAFSSSFRAYDARNAKDAFGFHSLGAIVSAGSATELNSCEDREAISRRAA